ncbi:Hypothetical predicted protein [Cloeon dipterum]|uniref:XPG N-terminal domain-containing protein n=1 Tax=Cloeon dipterum TaxID=197152 RepID=A0A8S1CFA9_9INSE|nr:Hypothetical predicted protein [Cloeon dipterum]
MGVHGLWKLLEPSGQPVALESMDNKVLAIDVSMWLHQALKGYHDASGNALPNAHLLGLFHRICKLMFYNIKPVFVFDGGVPSLKQQTLANRRQMKMRAGKRAEQERLRLLKNLMEQDLVQRAKGNTSGTNLKLPAALKKNAYSEFLLPEEEPDIIRRLREEEGEQSDESDDDIEEIITWENFNPNSKEFKALPAHSRLEVLSHLKDTRKQNSWGRIHEMPQESDDFSGFQMRRLLLRRSAQVELDLVEKELSKRHTLSMEEIKEIMAEKGSLATKLADMDVDYGQRIASDDVTRFILIKNPNAKKVAKLAVDGEEQEDIGTEVTVKEEVDVEPISVTFKGDIVISDEEEELAQVGAMDLGRIKKEVEDSDLTQEEILVMIHNERREVSDNKKKNFDVNQPSTSKACVKYLEPIVEETPKAPSLQNVVQLIDATKHLDTEEAVPARSSAQISSKLIIKEKPAEMDDMKLLNEDVSYSQKQEPETAGINNEEEIVFVENVVEAAKEVDIVEEEDSYKSSVDKEIVAKGLTANTAEKTIAISINPENVSKEDDLFADIFSSQSAPEIDTFTSSPSSAIGVMSSTGESSEDEIQDEVQEETAETLPETELKDGEPVSPSNSNKSNSLPDVPEGSQLTNFRNMNFTDEELKILEEKLVKESRDIVSEIGRQERIATNINDQMCQEAQELLALFGMPYVVAPMEAEAQCAIMDLLSLTHGTVTDDSDIWLFGGRTVYRNFFNQTKNVERYTYDTICKSFKLTRDRLILLAMLVGSDYTIGLTGVGPVTALEIIAEFSANRNQEIADPEDLLIPLKNFKEWCESKELTNMRRKRLKTSLRDVCFHDGFPSEAVVNAYIHPQVSEAKDRFSWSKPDIEGLIKFTAVKFGWSKTHAESVLDPVIKRMAETKVQGRLDSYFTVTGPSKDLDLVVSARVRNAINQLNGFASVSEVDVDEPQPSTSKEATQAAPVEKKKPKSQKAAGSPSKLNEFKSHLMKKPRAAPILKPTAEKPAKKINIPKKELIPQREKDKDSALQSKLKAIEIFRKRKIDPVVKPKRPKRLVAKDNYLSESSDSD